MYRIQNPFSFYDFLGYLIPGSLFLILFSPHFSDTYSISKILDAAVSVFSLNDPAYYFPFIILSYISGHILSFLSSVTIERYSIWTLGYPSKYILKISNGSFFSVDKPRFLRIIVRIAVAFLMLPVVIADFIVGKLLKGRDLYAKKLDDYTIAILLSRIKDFSKSHLQIENPNEFGNVNDQNFFRFIYHYTLENSNAHLNKFQNYVALYGFLRTTTLVSIFFFWYLVINDPSQFFSLVLLGILCFLLYTAYFKFSRRFSLEVLMAFSSITQPNQTYSIEYSTEKEVKIDEKYEEWFASDYESTSTIKMD